jgi:hypothetical protein
VTLDNLRGPEVLIVGSPRKGGYAVITTANTLNKKGGTLWMPPDQ